MGRHKKLWECNGQKKTLEQWAAENYISKKTLCNRLFRERLTLEEALKKPVGRKAKIYEIDGVSKPINEWCDIYKADLKAVRRRLKKGWDIKDALTRPVSTCYKAIEIEKEDNKRINTVVNGYRIKSLDEMINLGMKRENPYLFKRVERF